MNESQYSHFIYSPTLSKVFGNPLKAVMLRAIILLLLQTYAILPYKNRPKSPKTGHQLD
ncbi:MAG: hypothetical protein HC892_18310 [Saprospiraceae bacterium]|nr:hypothetical protein [Saprospiraceae bacterium]